MIPALAVAATIVVPAALLATVTLTSTGGVVAGGGCGGDGGPGGGSQRIGTATFSAEQMTNARTITSVARQRSLPQRAAVIAVTAALVESGLRNTAAGDRDSVGLFQERPSQGWGSQEDVLNPADATRRFLDHLVTVRDWESLAPGVAEQDVERSAFPGRYALQEPAATGLVRRFWAGGSACGDQGGGGPTSSTSVTLPLGLTLPSDPRESAAVRFALAQVGKPYVWGAKGPDAFDCSGLVQAAWAAAGVALDAGTTSQIHDGVAVSGLGELQPGDLLFTPGSLGTATNPRHVGLYIGHGLLVDAYDTAKGVIVQTVSSWQNSIVAIRRPTR